MAHPDGIDYEVHVVSDDPIVEGIDAFNMHSEQYYLHVDPGNEVLAATTFRGRESAPINGTTIPLFGSACGRRACLFFLGHVARTLTCRKRAKFSVAVSSGQRAKTLWNALRKTPPAALAWLTCGRRVGPPPPCSHAAPAAFRGGYTLAWSWWLVWSGGQALNEE